MEDDENQPQRLSKIEMKLRRKLKLITKQGGKEKKGRNDRNEDRMLGKRNNPEDRPETGATGQG